MKDGTKLPDLVPLWSMNTQRVSGQQQYTNMQNILTITYNLNYMCF